MNNTKKLTAISLIALFAFSIATVTLRSVALFSSFDWNTMHFDNSGAFTVSAILVSIAAFAFLSFIFLAQKNFKLAPDSSALGSFTPSGMLSVALIFMSFSMIVNHYGKINTAATGISKITSYIPYALIVLALLSAAFFFLSIMSSKRISDSKAALGMCSVAFLVLYGSYLFFTKDIHPTNSPNKIIDQMAYFSAAIFLLYETRISLGRDMWKPYISFGLISALLCAYSAIPAVILYFAKGDIISNSITETVLTLTLFVYIVAKLILTLSLPSDECCKFAETIEKMAKAREEELAEKYEAAHAHDYNINEENSAEDDGISDSAEQANEPTEGQISFELDGSEG